MTKHKKTTGATKSKQNKAKKITKQTIRKKLCITFAVMYNPQKHGGIESIAKSLLEKLVDEHQYSIANGGMGLNPNIEMKVCEEIIKEKEMGSRVNPDYTELVEAVSVGFEQIELPHEDEDFKQPK